MQLSSELELPQFELRGYKLQHCDQKQTNSSFRARFSCVKVSFVLERQMGYFFIQIYGPTTLRRVANRISQYYPLKWKTSFQKFCMRGSESDLFSCDFIVDKFLHQYRGGTGQNKSRNNNSIDYHHSKLKFQIKLTKSQLYKSVGYLDGYLFDFCVFEFVGVRHS